MFISDLTKQEVIYRLEKGESSRVIASALNIGESSINRIRIDRNIETPKSKGGAPSKLTSRDKRVLVSLIEQKKAKTAVEATRQINQLLDKPINPETARNALKELNFKSVKKIKKPDLSTKNRKLRLDWCHKHRGWTVADWNRVFCQTKPKSTELAVIDYNLPGSESTKTYQAPGFNQLSSLEAAIS